MLDLIYYSFYFHVHILFLIFCYVYVQYSMANKDSSNLNVKVKNVDSQAKVNVHVPTVQAQGTEFQERRGMDYGLREIRNPLASVTDKRKDCIEEYSNTLLRNIKEQPSLNVKNERSVSLINQTNINNTILGNTQGARGYVVNSSVGSISNRNHSSSSHIRSYQNSNGMFSQRAGTGTVPSSHISGTPRIISNRSMNTQLSSVHERGKSQQQMVGCGNGSVLNSARSIIYSLDVSKNKKSEFTQPKDSPQPSNYTKGGFIRYVPPNGTTQESSTGTMRTTRHVTDMVNRYTPSNNVHSKQGSARTITTNAMIGSQGSNNFYLQNDPVNSNEALSHQHPLFRPVYQINSSRELISSQEDHTMSYHDKMMMIEREKMRRVNWELCNKQLIMDEPSLPKVNTQNKANSSSFNADKKEMLKKYKESVPLYYNVPGMGITNVDPTKINKISNTKARTDDLMRNPKLSKPVYSALYPNYVTNRIVFVNGKRNDAHIPLKKHHQLFRNNETSSNENSGVPLVFLNPFQKYKAQSNLMQPRILSKSEKNDMNEINRKGPSVQMKGSAYSGVVTPRGNGPIKSNIILPVVNQRNDLFMKKLPTNMNYKPMVPHLESSESTSVNMHEKKNMHEPLGAAQDMTNQTTNVLYERNPLKREDDPSQSVTNSLQTYYPLEDLNNELTRTKQGIPKKRNSMVLDHIEELVDKKNHEDTNQEIPKSLFCPSSTPRKLPIKAVHGNILLFQNSKGSTTERKIGDLRPLGDIESKGSVGMILQQKREQGKVQILENKEKKSKEKGSTTSSLSTYITLNDNSGLSSMEKELCQTKMNKYLSYLPLVGSTTNRSAYNKNTQYASQLNQIIENISEQRKSQLKNAHLKNMQMGQTNRGAFLRSSDRDMHMYTDSLAIPLTNSMKNISSNEKRMIPQLGMQQQMNRLNRNYEQWDKLMEPSKESEPKHSSCGLSARKRVISTSSTRGTHRIMNDQELLTCQSIGYSHNIIMKEEKKQLRLPNEPSLRTVISPRLAQPVTDPKDYSWNIPKEMQECSKHVEKKAVVIGCNYPNMKKKRLYGAVNDAYAFSRTLVKYFGFAPEDIVLLTDTFPSDSYICEEFDLKRKMLQKEMEELRIPKKGNANPSTEKSKRTALLNLFHNPEQEEKMQPLKNSLRCLDVEMEHNVDLSSNHMHPSLWPTRTNILKAVNWLVRDTRACGSYVFYFAGKSIQVDNMSGWEGEGYDEAFLCSDPSHTMVEHNVITAIQLKDLLLSINCLAQMTILLDCSGGQTILDPAGTENYLTYIKGCKQKGIWPISNPTNKVHKAVYDTSILEHASMTKYFCQPRYASLTEVESTAAMIDPLLQSASSIPVTPKTYCYCAATWSQTALEGLFPVVEFARVRQIERKSTNNSETEQEKNKKQKKKDKKKGKKKSSKQKSLYEKKFDFSVNGMKSLFYKRKTKNTNPQICGVPNSEKEESCDDMKHKKKKETEEQERNKEECLSDGNSSCSNSTNNENENKNTPIVSHGIFTYCLIESIIEFKEQELKNNILEQNNNRFLPMTLKNLIKVVQDKINDMKTLKLKKLDQKPEVTLNPCANGSVHSYFVQYSKNIDFQNLNFNYLKSDLSPFLNVQKAWEEVHKNTLRSQNHKAYFNASLGLNSSMIPKPSAEVNSHRGVKNSYSMKY